MSEQKEVEDMEKFMTILMDVKVSLADQNAKLDNLLAIKEKVDNTYDTAMQAENRASENEKDISSLQEKVNTKATKDEVQRVVKERDNWLRNLPAWVAAVIALVALFMPFLVP